MNFSAPVAAATRARHPFLLVGLAALLALPSPAQDDPALIPGNESLLLSKLREHADASSGGSRDPERAERAAADLLRYDWADIDVPKLSLDFCMGRERAIIDGHGQPWGYDALPKTLPQLAEPSRWLDRLGPALAEMRDDLGDLSSRRVDIRKRETEGRCRCLAVPKLVCTIALDFNARLDTLDRATIERFQRQLRPLWAGYGLRTTQHSTAYALVPEGLYLRVSAWLGDVKAFERSRDMIRAWLAAPARRFDDNLVEATLALNFLATLHLGGAIEKERRDLLVTLAAHPGLPGAARAAITRPG